MTGTMVGIGHTAVYTPNLIGVGQTATGTTFFYARLKARVVSDTHIPALAILV